MSLSKTIKSSTIKFTENSSEKSKHVLKEQANVCNKMSKKYRYRSVYDFKQNKAWAANEQIDLIQGTVHFVAEICLKNCKNY